MMMDTNEEIIKQCKARWNPDQDDRHYEQFCERLPAFLGEFDGSGRDLMQELVLSFDYYSHSKVTKSLRNLYKKIKSVHDVFDDYTAFCTIKSKDGRLNSSSDYLMEFRGTNGIPMDLFLEDFEKIDSIAWNRVETVIFLDDICGSGGSFINFLSNNAKWFLHKKLIYAVIYMMKEGKARLDEYAKENHLDLTVLTCETVGKTFDQKGFMGKRSQFEITSRQVGIEGRSVLGFNGSESLVAFYLDTPNNTLGVFWKDTEKNRPIFPRAPRAHPKWRLNNAKEETVQRRKNNYTREVKKENG